MEYNMNTMNYKVMALSDSWGKLLGGKMDNAAYRYLRSNATQMTALENMVSACEFFGVEPRYNANIHRCSDGNFWSITVGKSAEIMILV